MVGLEQVALCHTRILNGLEEDQDDVLERLKDQLQEVECPDLRQLSDRLEKGMEGMMRLERVDGVTRGGVDGLMRLMSGYMEDIMSSLDLLRKGLCDISMDGMAVEQGGVRVLRDIAMVDCLEENLALMVCPLFLLMLPFKKNESGVYDGVM